MKTDLALADIQAAADRIKALISLTPVMTSKTINSMTGADIFFKCENFQKAGAFKFRGACNAVFSLNDQEVKHGVATHSSGNHGAALALAARLRGISAHIAMPSNAPEVKKAAVAGYGAQITFTDVAKEARQVALDKIVAETGALWIPSYDDPLIIAGQGTAGLEFISQVPDLDIVMTPISGGGLMGGTAIAVHGLAPDTQLIGAEPKGADDAYRSLQTGSLQPSINPHSIADGLLMPLSELTFAILHEHVSAIITVSEDAIINAMRLIWERMKIIIEPSSAVPVAALLSGEMDVAGKRVGIILSGGNVDLTNLPW